MSLRDKFIVRSSIGFGAGILVGIVITGLTGGTENGHICYCSPDFAEAVGNELAAFVIQAVVFGIYGAASVGGAVAYCIEDRSLMKVTLVHFCLVLTMFYAMAFCLRWIKITDTEELASFFLLFAIPYGLIWLAHHLIYKLQIHEMNKKLKVFRVGESEEGI